jgi:hypothetical protein
MKCPDCGGEVGIEDVFCGECGSPLAQKKGGGLAVPALTGVIGAVIGIVVCVALCAVVLVMWPTEPTPTPAGPAVLFQDDFSDPGSGWDVADYEYGSAGYADGSYFVTSLGDAWWIIGAANRSFENVIIEVDATQIYAPDDNDNGFGVMCRVQPDEEGYLLSISGDAYYSIYRILDGEFEALVDWTRSDVIQQGNATNRIRAVCDGSDLALLVNGELLAEATDSTFSEGDIGLTATSFAEEPTEVHFDNLLVDAPPRE